VSQNVFADMDLPNPEQRQIKAELVLAIRNLVAELDLSQQQIADCVGMTQPAVSRMLNGMTKDISIDKLLKVVTALGSSVRNMIGENGNALATLPVEFAVPAA
jgi:predicted XRE-type DNA-binding protein